MCGAPDGCSCAARHVGWYAAPSQHSQYAPASITELCLIGAPYNVDPRTENHYLARKTCDVTQFTWQWLDTLQCSAIIENVSKQGTHTKRRKIMAKFRVVVKEEVISEHIVEAESADQIFNREVDVFGGEQIDEYSEDTEIVEVEEDTES